MRRFILLLLSTTIVSFAREAPETGLLQYLQPGALLGDYRGVTAKLQQREKRTEIEIRAADPEALGSGPAWLAIQPPEGFWDLSSNARVTATIHNQGDQPAQVTFWLSSLNGWGAIGKGMSIPPGKTVELTCDLDERYPDGTPKLDAAVIRELRVMCHQPSQVHLTLRSVTAVAPLHPPRSKPGPMPVPRMTDGAPEAGKRVRYQSPDSLSGEIYGTLYLPIDWQADQRYPVVVEFPGNRFFDADRCWSTGRPEDCVMGYGITQGKGAIWICLPFIDRPRSSVAEVGFGSSGGDDTVKATLEVIDDLCAHWGGDRLRLFMTGFSRGAIACGYIGLRNDEIARQWKGFIACQHYDGSGWGPSTMESAVQRAPRFQGEAIFQIDNSEEKYRPVIEATPTKVKWTWVQSGLNHHSPVMLLDDRPTTLALRKWFTTHSRLP